MDFKPLHLLQTCPIQFNLMASFFTSVWKTEWAADVHWLFPWFYTSLFDPPSLLFFQVQEFLPSIWYIWVLAIGRWHWLTLVLRISYFLESSFLEINLWLTCCTSTYECLNTNLIFHSVNHLALWPMFFSLPVDLSGEKKKSILTFPLCL